MSQSPPVTRWGIDRLLSGVRRRWRGLLLVAGGGLLVSLIAVGGALTCRPAWYQPTSIDYASLKVDKRELVAVLDGIGTALNGGRSIELGLDEGQVNRWIAARAEIDVWETLAAALEPARSPQIAFLDGNRLRVAATVEWGGFRPVVSSVCRIELRDDQLVLSCESVRVGILPAPRGRLADLVGTLLADQGGARGRVTGRSVAVPNEGVWYNGKRRFRLTALSISNGMARLTLEPLDRNR